MTARFVLGRLAPVLLAAAGAIALDASQQTPAPQQAQPPVFRAETDVIRLDVSVLDKDRQPIRGLTANDFTVTEDGKAQRIVAVSEIDAGENDPPLSPWMRYTPRDVADNDLPGQAGDGRIIAVVMDDFNIPWDDLDLILNARNVGRYVVNSLGPSDVGAVVFPRDAGRSEDFTDDRTRLLTAIDKFDPREPDFLLGGNTDMRPGPGGGDMPQRFSPALDRSNCLRGQPTVPTFDTVVARLAAIPNRRKTVIFVSTGVPLDLAAMNGCASVQAAMMRDVFRRAQQANVNIYSIDPGGYNGFENYLMDPIRRGGRPALGPRPDERAAHQAAKFRRDFLEIMAEYTGARAVDNTDNLEGEIDRLFAEDRSYYLLGYQTSNGKPDGKYRRVEVKVRKPGAEVRARSGYFAPSGDSLLTKDQKAAPATSDLGLIGLMSAPGLPLRAVAMPVARAAGGREAEVAVVLTARLPPIRSERQETLTIVRNVYDADGRPGPPVRDVREITLRPEGGDELRYDVWSHLPLAPGRYQIRYNATSTLLGRSASVYADVEVPDFTRAGTTVSALVLGAPRDGAVSGADQLADLLPIVPTTGRDFAAGERLQGFVRVFQGGTAAPVPVAVHLQVFDAADTRVADAAAVIAADAFTADRSAPYQFDVPLERLSRGPHLLSLTLTPAGAAAIRRDIVLRVR